MANEKLANHIITKEEQRILVNVFKDPLATKNFIDLLSVVKNNVKADMDRTTQAFLMNDDPTTRALVLQHKGKVELLDELSTLILNVIK